MKQIFITIVSIVFLLPNISKAQIGTVKIFNSVTKMEKSYKVGVEYFDIDVSSISGWNKCMVRPLRVFQHEGQLRMRVDTACSTKNGELITLNCSTGKGDLDLSISQLLSTGSKLTQNNRINTNGYMDITLFCEYYR